MRLDPVSMVMAAMTLGWCSSVGAFEPEPVVHERRVEREELAALGEAVARVDLYRDNIFQYEAQVEKLNTTAAAMEGGTIEVLLSARRVTAHEVLVEPIDADRTRMILRHASPPYFGNFGTVWYPAQPSSNYWHMVAKPVGVRIGKEISLEMAKQVRKRDRLRVVGRVESMPIRIDGAFQPRVAAVVVDWKVVELIVDPDAEEIRY